MIIKWSSEDFRFLVTVSQLPGCRTDGRTYEEAVINASIIISEWIDTAKKQEGLYLVSQNKTTKKEELSGSSNINNSFFPVIFRRQEEINHFFRGLVNLRSFRGVLEIKFIKLKPRMIILSLCIKLLFRKTYLIWNEVHSVIQAVNDCSDLLVRISSRNDYLIRHLVIRCVSIEVSDTGAFIQMVITLNVPFFRNGLIFRPVCGIHIPVITVFTIKADCSVVYGILCSLDCFG